MKEKKILIMVYAVLIFALILSLYSVFHYPQTKLGVLHRSLYESLEYNLNVIEDNMNDITISDDDSKWAELKETYLNDKKLKETYNLLVSDIKACYLLFKDLDKEKNDNLKILSFKNKGSISEKQLLKLSQNNNCLEKFNKYDSMTLSNDAEKSEKIKKQLSIIIDYESEDNNKNTFINLLTEETITVSKITATTKWLKVEYNSAISG